jgi:hypothetical protein
MENLVHFDTLQEKDQFKKHLNFFHCFPLHYIKAENDLSLLLSIEPQYSLHDCIFTKGPKFTLKKERRETVVTMFSTSTEIFFFLGEVKDINDFFLFTKFCDNCSSNHTFEVKNMRTIVTKPCSDCKFINQTRLVITIE